MCSCDVEALRLLRAADSLQQHRAEKTSVSLACSKSRLRRVSAKVVGAAEKPGSNTANDVSIRHCLQKRSKDIKFLVAKFLQRGTQYKLIKKRTLTKKQILL